MLGALSSYCSARYGDLFSRAFNEQRLTALISSAVGSETWLLPETVLYRVRKNIDLRREDIRNFAAFSYPSVGYCKENGRAHIYGHPVLYCSDTAQVSVLESRPELGDSLYIACWTPKSPCKVMASFSTTQEALTNSFLFQMYAAFTEAPDDNARRANFLRWSRDMCNAQIADLFVEELYPYPHTSIYSHFLMYGGCDPNVDMVVYPSAQWKNKYINIAVKKETADTLLELDKVYQVRVQADGLYTAIYVLMQVGTPCQSDLNWREPTHADYDEFHARFCSEPNVFVIKPSRDGARGDLQSLATSIDQDLARDQAKRAGPDSVLKVQDLFSSAISKTNSGDYHGAIRELDRCIESAGFMATYRYQRGLCYHLMGKHDDAIRDYTDAVRLADIHAGKVSCHHKAYCNRGTCYQESGKYELAKRDFESALALRPDDYISHFNLGNCLVAMGMLAEALASYERALALNPSDEGIRKAKEGLAQQITCPKGGQTKSP